MAYAIIKQKGRLQIMHKTETILFGIAVILFGIASILIYNNTWWGFFEVVGIIAPIVGLIISTIGVFWDAKNNDSDDE